MALLSELSCPWPVSMDGCGLGDLDLSLFDNAVATASSIMTRLSAYTIGTCETEIRPLGLCPQCRSWCCGGTDALILTGPHQIPIYDVTRVRLGATEYLLNTWRFDRESQTLYRVPPDVWPRKDEKWSNAGEGEAFVVDAVIGTPPDAWALDVAARLVRELVLSCTGSKCRLPSNTTSVTATGITVQLRDREINTFIPELGAWMNAVNPHDARLPAHVFSPDLSTARKCGSNGSGGCRG